MKQLTEMTIKVENNLKRLRLRKGFTQEKVARLARISRNAYREIEVGNTTPNILTALLIADAMGEDISRLFHIEYIKIK